MSASASALGPSGRDAVPTAAAITATSTSGRRVKPPAMPASARFIGTPAAVPTAPADWPLTRGRLLLLSVCASQRLIAFDFAYLPAEGSLVAAATSPSVHRKRARRMAV